MSNQAIVRMMAEFGEFYWAGGNVQNRDQLRELASDSWREALIEFLRGYAFERQGASPHYSGAAIRAVRAYQGHRPGQDFEQSVWEAFLQEIGVGPDAKGAARKVNPLAVSYGGARSITSLILGLDLHDHNLIKWAAGGMANGRLVDIFNELQSVRGIGTKITAFFLRDIAVAFDVPATQREPAELLQPIDVWTRRGAEVLAGTRQASRNKLSDLDAARVIIEASREANVSPEIVNTGLWIFGANFARSESKFRNLLASLDALREFLAGERDYHINRERFLDKLLRKY